MFKEYLLNSSVHGLHFLADNKYHWTERVFWGLCVLASWAGSLILMLIAIQSYQSQQISFTVDTSYLDWKTNFPSIVFCEQGNPKSDEKIRRLFPGTQARKNVRDIAFYATHLEEYNKCTRDQPTRRECVLGNFSYITKEIKTPCSELITSCFYNGIDFPCCEEFLPIPTYYGTCFAFNSLASRKYRSGELLPFKIERGVRNFGNLSVVLSHEKVFVFGMSQDLFPTMSNSKFILLKSSGSNSVRSNTEYNSFLAVTETRTEDEARVVDVKRRGCRFHDENNLRFSKGYSESSCEIECLIDVNNLVCGCVLHTILPSRKSTKENFKECGMDGLICMQEKLETINNMTSTCMCSSSCSYADVKELGSTESPIVSNRNESVFKANFIVNTPTIRFTRTVVKTPLVMLVNVGGTVGLFIGASIITIVEILFYFIIRPLGVKYIGWKEGRLRKSQQGQDGTRSATEHHEYIPFRL